MLYRLYKIEFFYKFIRRFPSVIKGTSTLSLPGLNSSFPSYPIPNTPLGVMGMSRLLMETKALSNDYYGFHVDSPVQEVVLSLMKVHNLISSSQVLYSNQPQRNRQGQTSSDQTGFITYTKNLTEA